jgi:hypothetical protein
MKRILLPDAEALRDAAGELFGDLLEGGGKWRFLRLLLYICLVAAIVGELFLFRGLLGAGETTIPPVADGGGLQSSLEELVRLRDVERDFRTALELRTRSRQTALLAETAGRDPMGYEPPPPPEQRDLSVPPDLPSQLFVPPPTPVIPPPTLAVRAILIVGKSRTATMDIGLDTARIVREGDTFEGGQGKILKIDDKEVTVRWRNEELKVSANP